MVCGLTRRGHRVMRETAWLSAVEKETKGGHTPYGSEFVLPQTVSGGAVCFLVFDAAVKFWLGGVEYAETTG